MTDLSLSTPIMPAYHDTDSLAPFPRFPSAT